MPSERVTPGTKTSAPHHQRPPSGPDHAQEAGLAQPELNASEPSVVYLQRTIGNAATQRLLQRQAEPAQIQRADDTDDEQESFWKTLAKEEAIGAWGILKGMGTGAAGMVDSASMGITKALRVMGVDAADPLQYAKMLEEQYDASGEAMFGKDYKQGAKLLGGMNAGEIGSAGGGLIWNLVMAGAGPAGWAKGAKTGIDVAGNLGSMIDAANKIAEIIEKRQKQDTLSAKELLTDGEFLQACSSLALAIGSMMASGKKLDKNAAPALLQSLERLGLATTSAQALATINKIVEIQMSTQMTPEAQEKATASAVVELIGHGLSLYADTVGSKKLGEGADPADFDPNLKNLEAGDGKALELDQSNTPQNRSPEDFDPNLIDFGPDDGQSAPLELDTEGGWRGKASPEAYDPSMIDLGPADPNSAPLDLDTEGAWRGSSQSPADFDPNLRDLPVDPKAKKLGFGKGPKRPGPQTISEETGLGSPGTGPGGQSMRSTGMNYNKFDAAEVALGLRKDYRASPEHGGYQYLQSVEFDVPSVTGNQGTRGDRFGNDEMIDSIGINYPKHDDYTGTGFDRGHGAAQELSGGDEAVARALQTMSNIWPQTPDTNQHGGYRQLENFYKDVKAQNPGAHVRVQIVGTYGSPPTLVTAPSGARLAVPAAFEATITVEKPDGSTETINRTVVN